MDWFERWKGWRMDWHRANGLSPERLRYHQHGPGELAHYARAAFDIEFDFGGSLGFQEIEGIHNRGDFDLGRHQEYSGKRLEYVDQANNKRYIPFVIETAAGPNRTLLARKRSRANPKAASSSDCTPHLRRSRQACSRS
jgi:glycyl-tRNA synthetase